MWDISSSTSRSSHLNPRLPLLRRKSRMKPSLFPTIRLLLGSKKSSILKVKIAWFIKSFIIGAILLIKNLWRKHGISRMNHWKIARDDIFRKILFESTRCFRGIRETENRDNAWHKILKSWDVSSQDMPLWISRDILISSFFEFMNLACYFFLFSNNYEHAIFMDLLICDSIFIMKKLIIFFLECRKHLQGISQRFQAKFPSYLQKGGKVKTFNN